jgi:hypothetical protein
MKNSLMALFVFFGCDIFSCLNLNPYYGCARVDASASQSLPLQQKQSTNGTNASASASVTADTDSCSSSKKVEGGGEEGSCSWNLHKADFDFEDCTLVVAPSTIPNAGLGIFTLVDLLPDQQVGDGDMVIPMKELMMTTTIFDDYTWSGRIYQGPYTAYAPGFHSVTNSHLGLFNIFPQPARKVHFSDEHHKDKNGNTDDDDDDSTIYHHMTTVVGAHPIPAGGELFAMYGDHWFEGRSEQFGGDGDGDGDGSMMTMSLSDDYETAEDLAKNFQRRFGDAVDPSVEQWSGDLWDLVVDIVRIDKGQTLAQVLPAYPDLRQTQQLGIRSLFQYQTTRSVEELVETTTTTTTTARCIDGIRPGPSEIHHYGAFAKRHYVKGTVITGSPLLHSQVSLWNTKLRVWDAATKSYQLVQPSNITENNDDGDDDDDDDDDTAIFEKYALLINYCWSHVKSSILLCPYVPGVPYINHASNNAQHQSPSPNVKIQWAPHGQLSQNSNAFQLTPSDLAKNSTNKVSLALDYIALRDISPGEELLVDYGRAWEDAHDAFERQKKHLHTSAETIHRYNGHVILRTEYEQSRTPYPNDMELRCHPMIMTQTLPTEGDDEALFRQTDHPSTSLLLECSVLERQTVTISDGSTRTLYVMRVFYEGTWRGRGGIPRRYIRWFATKATASKVFRFPMQLPDDMVPDAWRDL